MKKLILGIAILFLCGNVFSQIYTPVVPTTYGQHFNRSKADSAQHVPFKTSLIKNTVDNTPQLFIYSVDSSLWAWTLEKGFWKVSGGSGGGSWGGITGNVIDQIDLYDSLLARVLKSDTASMLGNYIRDAGYGLIKNGQILKADSANLVTRAWDQKGKDSIGALIAAKLNISDTSSMLSNYLRGATEGFGIDITGSQHKTWSGDSTSGGFASWVRLQYVIDSLKAKGSFSSDNGVVYINSTYTINDTVRYIVVTGINVQITFPNPSNYLGRKITITHSAIAGEASNATSFQGSYKPVSDAANTVMNGQTVHTVFEYVSDGTYWRRTWNSTKVRAINISSGGQAIYSSSGTNIWSEGLITSVFLKGVKGVSGILTTSNSSDVLLDIDTAISHANSIPSNSRLQHIIDSLNSAGWAGGGSDGNGIYSGNGSLPSNITVTGADKDLLFNNVNSFKAITNPDGDVTTNTLDLAEDAGNGARLTTSNANNNAYVGTRTNGTGQRFPYVIAYASDSLSNTAQMTMQPGTLSISIDDGVDANILTMTKSQFRVYSLDTDHAPPTTSGTTKMVITDDIGNLSFQNIPTGGGASALDDLTDVTITTVASGDLLRYNGSAWVNVATIGNSNLTNSTISGIALGSNLANLTIGTNLQGTVGTYNGSAAVTVSLQNAVADGSTKGAASFTTNDFDATTGNISIDYTNGQAASASNKGFLTSADWTTFNGKISNVTLNNSIFVSKNGNDGTGAVGRVDLPFLTISAAIAAASAGQTVFVYPGIYDEQIILADSVNIYLNTGAIINWTAVAGSGSTIEDFDIVDVVIDGNGEIRRSQSSGSANENAIRILNNGTTLKVKAKRIDSRALVGGAVRTIGTVILDVDSTTAYGYGLKPDSDTLIWKGKLKVEHDYGAWIGNGIFYGNGDILSIGNSAITLTGSGKVYFTGYAKSTVLFGFEGAGGALTRFYNATIESSATTSGGADGSAISYYSGSLLELDNVKLICADASAKSLETQGQASQIVKVYTSSYATNAYQTSPSIDFQFGKENLLQAGIQSAHAPLNTSGYVPESNLGSGTGTSTKVLHGNNTWSAVSVTADISGVVPIANGGTNNGSLSVAAGTLYVGDGTKLVAIAPGTAAQHLTGGTTPSWKDTTVAGGGSGITIGTTTITSGTNTRILYNNSGIVGEYVITGTGNVVMSASPTFTGSPLAPTQTQGDNSTKLSTTAYVDLAVSNAVAGVNPAVATQAATTGNLNATYNNGVGGIGATLTNAGSLAAFSVDGYSASAGDRILVKDQTTTANNGVYTVTTLGSGAIAWILTRAADFNQPSDINNTGAIPVINGTVNSLTEWVITSTVNTVGTDAITFTEFTRNPNDYLLKSNNLSDLTNAGTARTNLGSTTIGGNIFTLTNPSAAGYIRTNADNTVTQRSYANVKVDLSLDAVENTALSTWAGSANITTLGTIGTGTWHGGVISSTYGGTGVNNGGRTLTLNTSNGTISFTTEVTLTVAATASVSGTNTGDQTTISGNAGTATTLQTSRNLWGQAFNGSANVTGDMTSVGSITASKAGFVLDVTNSTDAVSNQVAKFSGTNATRAANDLIYNSYFLANSTGTQKEFGRINIKAPVVTNASEDGSFILSVMSAGTLTDKMIMTKTDLKPNANDGLALGTSSLGWSDLFLATGAVIDFGAGNEVLTHSSGILTVSTGDLRVTTAGTNSASAVTVGGTQTLTAKTLTTPTIASITNTGTLTLPTVTGTITQYAEAAITSNATWSPGGDARDNFYDITAQAVAATTISNPSGSAVNHNTLIIRVKDNGTARALTWSGTQWRASTNLALPTTTTLSKTMYIKFIFNSTDTKWDLVSVLDGF